MTLREKQSIFARLIARFISQVYNLGYELTLGEAYRTPEQAAIDANKGLGITHSLHIERLAIDLLLFKNGVYLTKTEDYEPIGLLWESYSTPDYKCCWGGRFIKKDGNHFSIADGGRE